MNGGNDSVGREERGRREVGGLRPGQERRKRNRRGSELFDRGHPWLIAPTKEDAGPHWLQDWPGLTPAFWSSLEEVVRTPTGDMHAVMHHGKPEVPDPITNAGQYSHTRYCAGTRPAQSQPWFTWEQWRWCAEGGSRP